MQKKLDELETQVIEYKTTSQIARALSDKWLSQHQDEVLEQVKIDIDEVRKKVMWRLVDAIIEDWRGR